MLDAATDVEDFLAKPFGRYFSSHRFFVWCVDESLGGVVAYGQFDQPELTRLARATTFLTQPGIKAACDLSRVSDSLSATLVQSTLPTLVAGEVVVQVQAELDAICSRVVQNEPWLVALRRVLAERPSADLRTAAEALNISGRTLQRGLRHIGSSFLAEQHRARFALAERLLAHTTTKVSAVARTIGYNSDAHFSRVFKSVYGCTPSVWRTSVAA